MKVKIGREQNFITNHPPLSAHNSHIIVRRMPNPWSICSKNQLSQMWIACTAHITQSHRHLYSCWCLPAGKIVDWFCRQMSALVRHSESIRRWHAVPKINSTQLQLANVRMRCVCARCASLIQSSDIHLYDSQAHERRHSISRSSSSSLSIHTIG